MRRLFILVLFAILIGIGAAWLAEEPGRVVIDWRGWRLDASAVALGVLVLAIVVTLGAIYRLLVWLTRDTFLASGHRQTRRTGKGLAALTAGFNALAAGDAKLALRHARQADRLLDGEPVALLLTAQAAEAQQDKAMAEKAFTRLANRGDSATLGLRGLISRALREDDVRSARRLLDQTPEDKTSGPWRDRLRFDLAIRDGAWEEADETFRRLAKAKALDSARKTRIEAALLYARAREADLGGHTTEAIDLARRAFKKDESLSPAAALAARLLKGEGRAPDGEGILIRAWAAAPAPVLLEAALAGHEHDSTEERLRRVRNLVRKAPDHAESRLARAALALEVSNWAEARMELEAALKDHPGKRAYQMLARLERRENANEETAQDWLLEAETAPEDDRWHCSSCRAKRERWSLTCPECGDLATLEWGQPHISPAAGDRHSGNVGARSLLADLGQDSRT